MDEHIFHSNLIKCVFYVLPDLARDFQIIFLALPEGDRSNDVIKFNDKVRVGPENFIQ